VNVTYYYLFGYSNTKKNGKPKKKSGPFMGAAGRNMLEKVARGGIICGMERIS